MNEEFKEDAELSAAVRAAMEEGVALSPDRMRSIADIAAREARGRRRRLMLMRWVIPAAAAAMLGGIMLTALPAVREAEPADGCLCETIGLLYEIEGISSDELKADSAGDLLLAWQEAPCADLVE